MKYILSALILSTSLLLSTYFFTTTWKSKSQTLRVVGSATLEFSSDRGFLSGALSTSGTSPQIAFRTLEEQLPVFKQYLSDKNFHDLKFFPAQRNDQHEYDDRGRPTGRISTYSYYQRFEVQSDDVSEIEKLSLEIGSLVEKGLNLSIDPVRYINTQLSELKVKAQSLAAADARKRAQEIAAATDSSLGVIRDARMGVLQITPRYSTEISDYGMNDTTSIDKQITAVVQASFSITN